VNEAAVIRGMAWDHPRGRAPLEAVSAQWSAGRGIQVRWDARPLKDFEDQPLEDLATAYDLVLLDYPFAGAAAASGLIAAVDDWADEAYLADQAEHSAGPSHASYAWDGKQWALAIDAACQVGAMRDDLLSAAGLQAAPDSWEDVATLARELRDAPSRVAMPLNPNHSYCAFLSVGLSLAGPRFWPRGQHVDKDCAHESLEYLRRVAGDLHSISRDADPIVISDRMAGSDEIACVPLMFGYSNYARHGFRARTLRFANAPRGRGGHIGSVLGGVGLALSALSGVRDAAADLGRTIAAPGTQCGLYFDAGGQPGHAAAWESAAVNERVGGFFLAIRATMEQAFMRPRVPGHRRFQVEAGLLIHRCIWTTEIGPAECVRAYGRLVEQHLMTGDEDGGAAR
jgi:multiple sugar transport system substrate-binding protein